ncbi:chromate efflux transporter, partial [bacterium]
MTPQKVPLSSIAAAYLRVGATAFGGPVMIGQIKKAARKREWLTDKELSDGLSLVQLYPGPIGIDLVAYVGYKLRGVPGAIAACTFFVVPSFLLMLFLSWLYFEFGDISWVPTLFLGLEALVVGLLVQFTADLGKQNLRSLKQGAIAALSFAALLYRLNSVAIVLASLALGALFLRPPEGKEHGGGEVEPAGLKRWLGIAAVGTIVVAATVLCWLSGTVAGAMGLSFFKIGSVAFGNGSTILPLISVDVVETNKWLTPSQFADGIAMGQITPGPFLITAAFIGYKLAGVFGAALATFAIFSPSFVMTMAFTEVFAKVKHLEPVKGALLGVMASFVGLLALMVFQMG